MSQGANTVGNAVDMSLSRQVQLATIARIRHTYTRYDQLLREVSWMEARRQVEHICLAKLVEWRGEHDNDPEELEEVLRETIVIDEDDSDDDQGNEADGESDSDIEIVQQTIAPKDLRVDPNEAEWLPRRSGQTNHKTNTLPAAMRARWQNARNAGAPGHSQLVNPHEIVSVPLDRQGKAPRSIIENGVTYTRVSKTMEETSKFADHLRFLLILNLLIRNHHRLIFQDCAVILSNLVHNRTASHLTMILGKPSILLFHHDTNLHLTVCFVTVRCQ